jgi:hypothetical protein
MGSDESKQMNQPCSAFYVVGDALPNHIFDAVCLAFQQEQSITALVRPVLCHSNDYEEIDYSQKNDVQNKTHSEIDVRMNGMICVLRHARSLALVREKWSQVIETTEAFRQKMQQDMEQNGYLSYYTIGVEVETFEEVVIGTIVDEMIAVMSSDCETFRCIKNMLSWVKNRFADVRHSDRNYGYCIASLVAMNDILNILKVIALFFSHVDKYGKVVEMAEKFKEKIDGIVNQHWCSSGVSDFYSKVNRVESAVTAMIIDCIHRLSILPSSHATLPDIFHPNKLNI